MRRGGQSLATCAAALALGLPLLLLAAGCGKKGRPLPPLPSGPLAPREVRARQVGTAAEVRFVVPGPRGPRPAQVPVRAELVRLTFPPGTPPSDDPAAFRRRGETVAEVAADPLPGGTVLRVEDDLRDLPDAGEGATLRYAVRIADRRGRSSPLVVAPDLVPLPDRAPAAGLAAEPTAEGIRLVWRAPPGPGEALYNLYRSDVVEGVAEPVEQPRNREPLADPSFLDTEVEPGRSYEYVVRVVLERGTPYREAGGAPRVRIVAEDRFAPAPPTGLDVVQEGRAVRLFWKPSPERDLDGYRVERRDGDGSWRPVGPTRVAQPSWLDEDVEVGTAYAYRVVAVDRARVPNESGPSESVRIEVVAEPLAPGDER